jgi:TolA-binding protein
LHHRRQDWRAALADGEAFLREFPAHERAPAMRYSLGLAQGHLGDHAAARRTLAALAQAGDYERGDRVHYELAWACRRDGDEPAALAAFAAVLACSADEELLGEARLHLGVQQLQQQDLDGAATLLLAVQGRQRPRALYELAFSDLQAAGDRRDAAASARLQRAELGLREVAGMADEALALEATFLLGEIRARHQDHQGTAERLRALLERAPQHERAPRARLLLAEAAAALGDGAEAVEQSQRFLQGKPADRGEQARAWLAQGRGRQLRGEHERAASAFAKVTELSDGAIAAEAQFRIGDSRKADGDLAGAVDAYVKLPILYAHAEWVRRGLLQAGLACEQLGQADKAQKLFAELVQRHPDSTEAAAARARLDQKQQEP